MPAPSTPLKPHAVVVPWPGQGHINPLLHLSRRLAIEGFSITFVNMEYTHMRIMTSIYRQEKEEAEEMKLLHQDTKEGRLLHPPASTKLDIQFVSLPDGVAAADTRTSHVEELCRGVIRSSEAFQRLLEELQPPPTCIISDIFVLHTRDAANKLGIPRVAFWTQSAASYAVHLAAARGSIRFPLGSDQEKLINIVGAPPLRMKDFPTFMQSCDPASDFMFDFCTRPLLHTHEAVCVLMNTFDAMEGKAMEALRKQQPNCTFYTIGPVLPLEYFSGMKLSRTLMNTVPGLWAEDYSCLTWLDKQEEGSVLYVSFGSITELSGEEMEEFAMGLEASGVSVLWVLRPGLLEGGGQAALPAGFEERNKGRLLIIEWAPQLHVLAHPAVGGFFTHAGWNSTLEGVAQGKPLLGFPYIGDQMLNCRCIEDEWGNGLALECHGEGLLTRSLVENKVRAVMRRDSKLRHTALNLRDGARHGVLSLQDHPRSSTANFNTFIHSLTTWSRLENNGQLQGPLRNH